MGPELRRRRRAPARAPRAARGRRGRRHRRARPGERRGAAAPAGRLHRRRRPVHAAGPGRLDDRRRHPRRRLRRVPVPDRRPRPATSWWPASPATRRRSRRSPPHGDRVVLLPANPRLGPMEFDPGEVRVFGRVVTVCVASESGGGSGEPAGRLTALVRVGAAGPRRRPTRASPTASPRQGPMRQQVAERARARRRASARSTRSSLVWASVESPGPKLAAGMPAAANRLTSVQPSLARTSSRLRSRRAASSGCVSPGGGGAGHVDHLHRVALVEVRARAPPRRGPGPASAGAVGGEAVVERDHRAVGHDVARHAALDEHRLQRLAELAAVDDGPALLVVVERRQQPAGPVEGVASHPRAGGVGPGAGGA